ncbi:hypothetical protein LCL97_13240 [Seohaeicola saemankumensis]|nr:hypothetical protein [Seohaeicola saemankumensis]MCA0871796.1 hypothetical protein [Seohaeicola saemankumensis]
MIDTITFAADRSVYIRSHLWLAALASATAMLVLWLMDNPFVWTGLVAGIGGIGVRGWYLASEELSAVWELDSTALTGPAGQRVPLAQVKTVKTLGSFVQIVTNGGDKHLIKYQADPAATVAQIERATLI